MTVIDERKLRQLKIAWIEHEHWIQAGCPDPDSYTIRFPGYGAVARAGGEAYAFYRHAFVPFFAEADGFPGLHAELLKVIRDLKSRSPQAAGRLFDAYAAPDSIFRAQWENLFDVVEHDGLSHQTLLQYQRKFEVELPLQFLVNIRELGKTRRFDPNLSRFRDQSGRIKKGVVVQYLKDGFKRYPAVPAAINLAYDAKLRNAIGHNAYTLSAGQIRALEGGLIMSEQEFIHRLDALQAIQNAVLWLLTSGIEAAQSHLCSAGVIGIRWGWDDVQDQPHVTFMQLEPFHSLQPDSAWLDQIRLDRTGDMLVTRIGDVVRIEGVIPTELEHVLQGIQQSGSVECTVVPVMPCIHEHPGYMLPEGEFCQAGRDGGNKTIPVLFD